MKYKIGDVAYLLGITPEAIRYYEKQGLVVPDKSKTSGYRYYSSWDIHILISARIFRKYGYSLLDTANMINSSDPGLNFENIERKEKNIEDGILKSIQLLGYIREYKKMLKGAMNFIGKYKIDYSPGIYRLEIQDRYKLIENKRIMYLAKQWINKAPYIYTGALFKKADIEKNREKFSFGINIDKKYVDFLKIKKPDECTYHKSRLCVYTVMKSFSNEMLSISKLNKPIKYLKAKRLVLDGDILTRVILTKKLDNKYTTWHEVWIPFKNNYCQ